MLKEYDLTPELYREYEFGPVGNRTIYRIDNPVTLYLYRKIDSTGRKIFGTTHRVLDSEGIAHCVPGVGLQGCVLRWKTKDSANPVTF